VRWKDASIHCRAATSWWPGHLLGDIERVAFMSVAELVAGAARLRSEGLIE